jgi:hypothetical protein
VPKSWTNTNIFALEILIGVCYNIVMTRHTGISYLKSAIRIIGYIIAAHVCPIINMAMLILIFAEVLGIAEEWGEKYGRK